MLSVSEARPPYVEFKQVAIDDPKRSLELGYRVTRDVDRVFIMQPGSKDCLELDAEQWLESIKRKALQNTHDRYPEAWVTAFREKFDAYKKGLEPPLNGTSIKQWPALSPSLVNNFLAIHIYTVEDVAAMNEEAMSKVGMGARDLREKAREWLRVRDIAGEVEKENGELKERLAQSLAEAENIKAQLAQVMQRLSSVETKPRRGRPPKVKEPPDVLSDDNSERL